MKVLGIGSAADATFVHTLEALKRAGADFDALDLGQLAYGGSLEIPGLDLRQASFSLHGRHYGLDTYRSVFVRMLGLAPAAPSERLRRRAAAQFQGLSLLFSSAPLPVVNPPWGDNSNAAKLFHAAALAPLAGWRLPRSCLTSQPAAAREFIASCPDGVIYKGAGGGKTYARLYLAQADDARLALLPSCPVLFQERIAGPDVRVHVIGERCFGELIESPEPDYRRAAGNRFSRLTLPPEIAAGCAVLTRASGKPFLGVDFKIQRHRGKWFFLEANPQPGYDYYDGRAGGAISRALVEFLTTGAP